MPQRLLQSVRPSCLSIGDLSNLAVPLVGAGMPFQKFFHSGARNASFAGNLWIDADDASFGVRAAVIVSAAADVLGISGRSGLVSREGGCLRPKDKAQSESQANQESGSGCSLVKERPDYNCHQLLHKNPQTELNYQYFVNGIARLVNTIFDHFSLVQPRVGRSPPENMLLQFHATHTFRRKWSGKGRFN